jgi:hypothetical protein
LTARSSRAANAAGGDNPAARVRYLLASLEQDERGYREYAESLRRLLALGTAEFEPGRLHISHVIPHRAMGEPNSVFDLMNYTSGPSSKVNYFALLGALRVRNNVQPGVESRPIDLIAARLEPRRLPEELAAGADTAVFLYRDEEHQAILLARGNGAAMRLLPVARLFQTEDGAVSFERKPWAPGFPLQLFEDPNFAAPGGDPQAWLGEWHSDTAWLEAVHRTRYSNAVIGLAEHFGPIRIGRDSIAWRDAGPDAPLLERFQLRKRRLVQADMLLLASNHWNFNVRGFNPGGNHGSFFRVSTLSTLMLAGSGVPAGGIVERPYDSLSFVPTILRLSGMADQVQTREYPGRVIEELLR